MSPPNSTAVARRPVRTDLVEVPGRPFSEASKAREMVPLVFFPAKGVGFAKKNAVCLARSENEGTGGQIISAIVVR